MIRVLTLYPSKEGSKFDFDYYMNTHMKLVRERLGSSLVRDEVDQGLGTIEPGTPAPFQVVCHMWFNSMDEMRESMGTHGPELIADIPNYTDIIPVSQVSEIADS